MGLLTDKKIAVVDDMKSVRDSLKVLLGELGAENIREAEDGEKALEILADLDIIFVDINMPVMDGLTLVKKIKDDPRFEDIKVIMVTTHSESDKIVQAIELGVAGYINKPFEKETIIENLKEVL